jgi:hypothetical protein
MNTIFKILGTLFLLFISISEAQAIACAKGVYRAGCVTQNGAVVATRPAPKAVVVAPPRGGAVVVKPAPNCAWVNGRKVCR